MKKVYFALALCLAGIMMFIASCSKENQKVETLKPAVTWEDWSKSSKITTIADLKADVKVESGILHFNSLKDLKNVTNFLSNAPKEEITKWENTLIGFTSVHKYLDMAKEEFRLDSLNERKFSELKIKYSGKVKFIDKDQRIRQIVPNGSIYGRIIGLGGEYIIGKTTVLYYKGKVISVPAGDENKLEVAKNSLQNNPKEGIFVHNLRIDDDIKSLKTRNVNGHWNWDCSNNCPVYEYRSAEGPANGQYYWLTQEFDMINNSCWEIFSDPYGNYPYQIGIDVRVHIDIEHRRRRGWLIHYYTPTYGGFNWGFGWGVDMDLKVGGNVVTVLSKTYVDPSQAGGWSWNESNSDLDFDIPLWKGEVTGNSQQFGNFSFNSCVRRTGLISSSNNDPVNIRNQQYCQDGNTIF